MSNAKTILERANPKIDASEGVFDVAEGLGGSLLKIIEESTGRVQGGVRRKIQEVFSPFEQFREGVGLYSPVQLREEEIDWIASSWKKRENMRSCIVSELALRVIQDRDLLNEFDERIEIDIATTEGRRYLTEESAELRHLANEKGIIIIIHHIEEAYREDDSLEEGFQLQGVLRYMEDEIREPSLLLCAVSAGKSIPRPMIDRNSPFGLSMEKRYFTSPIGGTKIDMSEVPSASIEKAFSTIRRPLNSIDGVYKNKRKELYRGVIEKLMGGQNMIYVGLRRGGKTSLRQIAEDTWRQSGGAVEHMPFTKRVQWNKIARIAIRYIFPDLVETEIDRWCGMGPEECAEQMGQCWNKDGRKNTPENRDKRLLITGDETWDRELGLHGEDGIMECLTFYKAISEKQLPVQFFELMTDVHYEKWMDTTKDNNIKLSTYGLAEGYIIEEREAVAYAEFLIEQFSMNMSETARHRLAEFIVDVCGESIVTLQKCMYTIAMEIKHGRSFEEALYGAITELAGRNSDDPHAVWLSYMKHEERLLISCMALSEKSTATFANDPVIRQSIENLSKKGFITHEIHGNIIMASIALKLLLVLTRNLLNHVYADYKAKNGESAKDLQAATLEGAISINSHPFFSRTDEILGRK